MENLNTIIIGVMLSTQSLSALPPKYQNEKDLNVLVNFIKKHPHVISTLQKIDFETMTIYFAGDCRAEFARKHKKKPIGWSGPADPLEFKKSNCEIDNPE